MRAVPTRYIRYIEYQVTRRNTLKYPFIRYHLFVPILVSVAAITVLLIGLEGTARVAHAEPSAPVCFAKAEGGTVFESATFTAPQAAVDSLGASGGVVLVAGTCTGVQVREGVTQTVYISAPVTLRGGYNTDFTVFDPDANPTVLDAAHGGRVVYASVALTVENLIMQYGTIDGDGGGVFAGADLVMNGTQVLGNMAHSDGGGIYTAVALTVTNSLIQANHSMKDGGGLQIQKTLYISAAKILSNTAEGSGGGFIVQDNRATVINSYIENNHSENEGGGLLVSGDLLVMSGTQVLGNTALRDGGGIHGDYEVIVANSRIENNHSATNGGGIWAGEPLTMTNTQVLSNTAKTRGGGIWGKEMLIVGSRVENNYSDELGGGIYSFGDFVYITSTRIISNMALGNGGGVFVGDAYNATQTTLANSLLVSNTANAGGGIYTFDERTDLSTNIVNSTLAANSAVDAGGAISSTGSITVANSILWQNSPSQVDTNGLSSVTRSIIQGGELGGIDQDPRFVRNPNRATGDLGDLHLRGDSTAIDSGEDDRVPQSLTKDLDGNPRLSDVIWVANNGANVVDMGAFEAVAPTANAGGAYTGDEGSPVAFDASGSSGVMPLTAYGWDCTDDGTIDIASVSPTGSSCTYADNGNFTVRLLITDTSGLTGTATTTAIINNVSPVVSAAPTQSAEVGTAQSFSLGSFSDAGVDDNPWQIKVDWGDSAPETSFSHDTQSTLPEQSHTYTVAGQYSVTVTVTDKDGDPGSATFTVDAVSSLETLYLPTVRSQPVE